MRRTVQEHDVADWAAGFMRRLEEPRETEVRPKSYAENFKFGRPDRWTH